MIKNLIVSDHVIIINNQGAYTSATVLFPDDVFSSTLFGRLVEDKKSLDYENLNEIPTGIKITGYLLKRKGGIGYILSAFSIIKSLSKNIRENDIIILKMPYFSSIISVPICIFLRKKYVLYFIGFGGNNLKEKNKPYLAFLTEITLGLIVYLSKNNIFVSKELKANYKYSKDCMVLPEINNKKYESYKNLKIKNTILSSDSIKIGYLGRFSEEKGVLSIADLTKDIDFIDLSLIGDGDLKEIVLKDLVKNNILFKDYGWIKSGNSLFDKISELDLMIVPSKTEGFGLVVIESNVCGVPVLASNVGGLKSVVVNDVNGYLLNGIEEFREKISELHFNRDKLNKLKINSKKYAENFLEDNDYQYRLRLFLNEVLNIK